MKQTFTATTSGSVITTPLMYSSTMGEHKKPVRVYLTAFQDVRSRKFMGWYVTMNPCSDATLIALRRGIEKVWDSEADPFG